MLRQDGLRTGYLWYISRDYQGTPMPRQIRPRGLDSSITRVAYTYLLTLEDHDSPCKAILKDQCLDSGIVFDTDRSVNIANPFYSQHHEMDMPEGNRKGLNLSEKYIVILCFILLLLFSISANFRMNPSDWTCHLWLALSSQEASKEASSLLEHSLLGTSRVTPRVDLTHIYPVKQRACIACVSMCDEYWRSVRRWNAPVPSVHGWIALASRSDISVREVSSSHSYPATPRTLATRRAFLFL